MNRRQKAILIESLAVIAVTAIAVWGMVNLKDWINRSEAMRAMEQLGEEVLQYRTENGSVPPESYVERIKETLEGHVRLGRLQYRARWIGFDATSDEILAYTEKSYPSSLLDDGYVVLRLDGRVQWMKKRQFETLLAQQQSQTEIDMTQQ